MSCGTCAVETERSGKQVLGAAASGSVCVTLGQCARCGCFTTKDGDCHNPRCSLVSRGKTVFATAKAINDRQFRATPLEESIGSRTYTVCGREYTFGERSADPGDWSIARVEPPKGGGVRVGSLFERAAGILAEGRVVKMGTGLVEVYDTAGNLVSAYDTHRRCAADIHGNAQGSPEQFAAVMAAAASHYSEDERPPGYSYGLVLEQDLDALRNGSGSALAVADSFYLFINRTGFMSEPLTMGGKLKARHCAKCGAVVGNAGCFRCEMDGLPGQLNSPSAWSQADEDTDHFCPRCGQAWAVHDAAGCVSDEEPAEAERQQVRRYAAHFDEEEMDVVLQIAWRGVASADLRDDLVQLTGVERQDLVDLAGRMAAYLDSEEIGWGTLPVEDDMNVLLPVAEYVLARGDADHWAETMGIDEQSLLDLSGRLQAFVREIKAGR